MKVWFAALFLFILNVCPAGAQNNAVIWRYTLLDASEITEDCPICGRPTIPHPLRGTFDLALLGVGPLFTEYRITNISFSAGPKEQPLYTVTGNGTYSVGGEVAVRQDMLLQTEACNSAPSCRDATFTNDEHVVSATFPLLDISLTQTQVNLTSVYSMRLVAAPAREIWFTVTNGFASTNGVPSVRAGDLLSNSGRIVRTNTALLQSIGITNPSPALRINAFDIAPGGEIVFSLNGSAGSSTLGALSEGDLLSDRGRIVQRNQELTARFGIQPAVPDIGLDAAFVMTNGEILFSIRTNIFAEGKGLMLRHGDVLSNTGVVLKSNQQLLARFHPTATNTDFGLDALYVWPNGEIWFSTEAGFDDSQLVSISAGDLLSTEGVIVFRNAELLSAFGAPQDISNFGLSDVFVISDAVVASAPEFLSPRREQGALALQWLGTNRVFHLERATNVIGPWQTVGEIDPDSSFRDTNALSTQPRGFYRLRGW
jgi:hypothetical protein